VSETETVSPPSSTRTEADRGGVTSPPRAAGSDAPFFIGMCLLGGFYIFMIFAMLIADAFYTSPGHLLSALNSPEIRYSIKLSLISCTLTALFSLWVAVPLGYLMSRYEFPLKHFLDAVLDIPIVLPPLVVGLSLLILFQTPLGKVVESVVPVTYAIPSVILAQFMVAAAFAVRTMRQTFDQITPRQEQVALTLGCTRSQAFFHVVLPEARRGMITAATLAWARALGEFGPILIFSGSTRMRTEVLSVSVYLEFSVGQLNAAVAVSLLMVITSILVLVSMRAFGFEKMWKKVS
jgi:molybdate transport system permease protein